jgi:hypothetical protein
MLGHPCMKTCFDWDRKGGASGTEILARLLELHNPQLLLSTECNYPMPYIAYINSRNGGVD